MEPGAPDDRGRLDACRSLGRWGTMVAMTSAELPYLVSVWPHDLLK
jgi:hypothetical protein